MKATSSQVIARNRDHLRSELDAIRRRGRSIGLVPTMGSLHAGHLSLIDRAVRLCDEAVVSVFVNRLQFGRGEDFDTYPRNLEKDLQQCADRGVQLVFAPSEEVMYPFGRPRIQVDPGEMGQRLCGPFRPGHFRGVLTVVAKLLGLVRPDVAVFGRKDFQQAVLIRRMVEDLELGVRIEVAPLVRDFDGLALSSRNAYLTPEERRDAVGLWHGLSAADRRFRDGETRSGSLLEMARDVISGYRSLRLQYVEVVDPQTLDSVREVEKGAVIAAAAFCGRTRLIDNLVLGHDVSDPRAGSPTPEESSA